MRSKGAERQDAAASGSHNRRRKGLAGERKIAEPYVVDYDKEPEPTDFS